MGNMEKLGLWYSRDCAGSVALQSQPCKVELDDAREEIHRFIKPSQTITLFSQQSDIGQGPSSFVVSILLHVAVFGVVLCGIASNPKMSDPILVERYAVRHLDLHTAELEEQPRAASKISYPGPHLSSSSSNSRMSQSATGGNSIAQVEAARQIAHVKPGLQTLVQPTLAADLTLTQAIPIPTVMIWTPEIAPVKTIVAPRPEEATAADVQPSFDSPNEEKSLADRAVSATGLSLQTETIQPGTTSPLIVHGPDRVQKAPATTSEDSAQPTPTAVLSLSDLRLKEGTVTLPPANVTTSSAASGGQAQTHAAHASQSGDLQSKFSGSGAGEETGDAGKKQDTAVAVDKQSEVKTGAVQQTGAASGAGRQLSTARITLAKDGQFGSVIVGSPLKKIYSEVEELWGDRVAYTVYLHVGLSKSWILQYSVPRAVDAAAAGSSARLEAPWPYNIVRPNLDPDAVDANVLMVHGYVDLQGRFENLAVVYPPEFAQTQFLLTSLALWQFRPAAQNGNPVRVEVLLIIPEESE